jgi:hypothetical protein
LDAETFCLQKLKYIRTNHEAMLSTAAADADYHTIKAAPPDSRRRILPLTSNKMDTPAPAALPFYVS